MIEVVVYSRQAVAELADETDPFLAVVISDFGRDAALRFCSALSSLERRELLATLPEKTPFFDEHRRIRLAVVGDLPYVKQPWLEAFRKDNRQLDETVLVGFPGGIPLEAIVPRLGVLVLEALAGPASRGVYNVAVALPCNTLAPASWALAEHFASAESLTEMIRLSGRVVDASLPSTVTRVTENMTVRFPTVPEAVLRAAHAQKATALLPLGTAGIGDVYRQAAERLTSPVRLVATRASWQRAVFEAIQSAIEGGTRRHEAQQALAEVLQQAATEYGNDLLVVEACTDLEYGLGLDSTTAYARAVLNACYDSAVANQ